MREILGSRRLKLAIAVIAGLSCLLVVILSSVVLLRILRLDFLLSNRGEDSLLAPALFVASAIIGYRSGIAVWYGSFSRGQSMNDRRAVRAALFAMVVFGIGSGIANALVISQFNNEFAVLLLRLGLYGALALLTLMVVAHFTAWGRWGGFLPYSREPHRDEAERGDAYSQWKLASMYESGEGVAQDKIEAVKWYRRSAEQGYPSAQQSLGSMYMSGQGVPKDYVRAHMWFSLASEYVDSVGEGDPTAIKARDAVAARMTKAQIEQAVVMAAERKASNFGRRS